MKDEKKTKAQLVAELAPERQRRLKLEAVQREREERFRRLVENAPDVVFRLNLLPMPRFDYLSPAIEQMTGYAPETFYKEIHHRIKNNLTLVTSLELQFRSNPGAGTSVTVTVPSSSLDGTDTPPQTPTLAIGSEELSR